MEIVRTQDALKNAIRRLRLEGKTIGCVPTMGALHSGHLSLIAFAKKHVDAVVVTIFVNPTQFGPNEDFSRYPRTEEEDIRLLQAVDTAIVYLPTVETMYPPRAVTQVVVPGISDELCGAFRPGHFTGVATIVTKLLLQVQPDVAVFGEKDYQQLHIIHQVVCDLDITVTILGAPLIREADGLAMSSRNRYLSESERKVAASLYAILAQTAASLKEGQAVDGVLHKAKAELLARGFRQVDYIEWRDSDTLAPATSLAQPSRLIAAAYLGSTRLIDNIVV